MDRLQYVTYVLRLAVYGCYSCPLLCSAVKAQALAALKTAVDSFERPVFPCALIAGDVVLLHLLSRIGALDSGQVTVVFIDTFHLFSETIALLHQLEVYSLCPSPTHDC